jgi:uncharacterized protein YndB with AHSA1/START domain
MMSNATIDRDTHTIRFERRMKASPEDVFDAWTRPEEISEWWDPTGERLAKCVIDLRPNGSFLFENTGHHGPPFAGIYRVVERPTKLVFDAMGAVGTVTLTAEGETTHMRVEIRCSSAEHLRQFVQVGVDTNTAKTLDNLVARLSKK